MSELKKYINVRPGKGYGWLTTSFSEHSLWDGIVSEMEVDGTLEIKIVELTEKEFKNLPEFVGW